MDLKNLKIADEEDVKGKKKEDPKENIKDTKTEDVEEEEDESKKPLEIGGFLTPVNNTQPTIDPPKEVLARDLSAGHAILLADGRPCEVLCRTDTRAQQGPLASRHKIVLELVELFDRGTLDPLVVKATEKLKRVDVKRVKYTVVCLLFSFLFLLRELVPSLSLSLSLSPLSLLRCEEHVLLIPHMTNHPVLNIHSSASTASTIPTTASSRCRNNTVIRPRGPLPILSFREVNWAMGCPFSSLIARMTTMGMGSLLVSQIILITVIVISVIGWETCGGGIRLRGVDANGGVVYV